MPELSAPNRPVTRHQGVHFELIKNAIPQCLLQSSTARRKALKAIQPDSPDGYEALTEPQQSVLKKLAEASCHAQNQFDLSNRGIQDITGFAKPLLVAALKSAGHELDVDNTWLRLYYPVEYTFFGIPVGVNTAGYRTRTFSLLQAALNNFEAFEAQPDYFDSVSSFISAPDAQGHFDIVRIKLTLAQFVAICRTLDIGGLYAKHLNDFFHGGTQAEQVAISTAYTLNQKAALKAAAYLALLKEDIELRHYELLVDVIHDKDDVRDNGRPITYSPLRILGYNLTECAVFFRTHANRYDGGYVIAYIPDDPDHPVKTYPSFRDFEAELTHQLMYRPEGSRIDNGRDVLTDYQRFFSRFLSEKDRPHFFLRLTQKVLDSPAGSNWKDDLRGYLKYLSPVSNLKGPIEDRHWRRDPRENVELHISLSLNFQWVGLSGIWYEMFGQWRQRRLDDGQVLAVSTAKEDTLTRERRLSNFLNVGMLVVGIAAFVAPPVGAAMLLVTANQLISSVFEGVRDWRQGDVEAAWAHLTDVLESLATLAEMAVIFHYVASPFVEGLKAVKLPNGQTRLWKPSLSAYARRVPLPTDLQPDHLGLYRLAGRSVLLLDEQQYEVVQDPQSGHYSARHPTRGNAYQPRLRHNGEGVWTHELDQPLQWQGAQLRDRLGVAFERFDDVQRKQILAVSTMSEDVLRKLYVESEPFPGLLKDTLRRFAADADAREVIEQIRRGRCSSTLCDYAAALMVDLPGWPANTLIEVFSPFGEQARYGLRSALAGDILRVSKADLMAGKLPERSVQFLNDEQIKQVLGQHAPADATARAAQLQQRLAAFAERSGQRLFNSLYSDEPLLSGDSQRALIQVIQRRFPEMPTSIAREVLYRATPKELETLNTPFGPSAEQRRLIPLRISEALRYLQQRVRIARAYEGLYLESPANPDTPTLVLKTLETLPGWSGEVRIELRDESLSGSLRTSVGPPFALETKVLVKNGTRYQAFDGQGHELHAPDTLYAALQHALPDSERTAMGRPHVSEAPALKHAIQDNALAPKALRKALNLPVETPWFERVMRVAARRDGYPLNAVCGEVAL